MKKQKILKAKQAQPGTLEGRIGLVYARVSSKKQETEGSGLQSQEGRCKAELEKLGVPYLHSFLDSYTGGGDFMERPAMRKLLAYIDAHPHKEFVVVFDDLKRFARDVEFHFKLRREFAARDVVLQCLNYTFGESDEAWFAELISAGQAELDRRQNKRQVIQKMKARLELGYWAFGRKRGYDMVRDPHRGKVAVPSKDAPTLREALVGFALGKLPNQIDVARYLNDHEFWGKGKTPEQCLTHTKRLLRDCFYCGYLEYPAWDVKRIAGEHEGLISWEVYKRIQTRLDKPAATMRERLDMSPDFPLRGLVLCPSCGKPLTGAWAKRKYAYYYCQHIDCPLRRKTSRKEAIEGDFISLLKRNSLRTKVEPVVKLAFERVWKQELRDLDRKEALLLQRRKELQGKITELTELTLRASSATVRKAYESQIEEAGKQLELAEIPASKSDMDMPYQTALAKALCLLKRPDTVWANADVHEKRQLFFFLFEAKLAYDREAGYQTGDSLSTTRLFEEIAPANSNYVDPAYKTLNSLKSYLEQFWDYYQSSVSLQNSLKATR